jgi:hypothetical protein
MHLLKKNQILRLVEALSKLNASKLNRIVNSYRIQKAKFKGFTGESFEKGLVAVYQCQVGNSKPIFIHVNWSGNKFDLAAIRLS